MWHNLFSVGMSEDSKNKLRPVEAERQLGQQLFVNPISITSKLSLVIPRLVVKVS